MRISAPILLLFLSLPFTAQAQEKSPAKAPTVELVSFSAPKAAARLKGKYTADFFALANQFEPQMNLGTCGPTSSVIVLNSLRPSGDSRRPIDESAFPAKMKANLPPGMDPVAPRYTQRTFFDERFEKIKPKEVFYGTPNKTGTRDPGIQLRQLGEILKLHELDVTIQIVSDETKDSKVRKDLLANLATAGDYVIVNYSRKVLGQPGGGHISPVAAFDPKSDSFLVLDTNPNKAGWVWVPAKTLIAAMRTHDTIENRGYLLVKEQPEVK